MLSWIPRSCCSLHMTSSEDGLVSLMGAPSRLFGSVPPGGCGQPLAAASRLYLRAIGAWARVFTPGALIVTERHPQELAATVLEQAKAAWGRGCRVAVLSLVVGLAASMPRLTQMFAARQRARQVEILRQQQEEQQRAQQLQQARAREAAAGESEHGGGGGGGDDDDAVHQAACIICCDAARNVILLPCAHQVVCGACAVRIQARCPVCRDPVANVVYVRADADELPWPPAAADAPLPPPMFLFPGSRLSWFNVRLNPIAASF